MKNDILKLFQNSAPDAQKNVERRAKKAKELDGRVKKVEERATKNFIQFIRCVLEELILTYRNNPKTIGNFLEYKAPEIQEEQIERQNACEIQKAKYSFYAGSCAGYAEIYNYRNPNGNKIYFYKTDYEKNGKIIRRLEPVLIDRNWIRQHSKFFSTFNLSDDTLQVSVSVTAMRDLIMSAHYNAIDFKYFDNEAMPKIFNKKLIQLLKETYDELERKEQELKSYLARIENNADIRTELYRKLLAEYKKKPNPSDNTYVVTIFGAYPEYNTEDDIMRKVFMKSSLRKNNDEICSLYSTAGETRELIPVQKSVLEQKLMDDFSEGLDIGFKDIKIDPIEIRATFDKTKLEAFLLEAPKLETYQGKLIRTKVE